MKIIIAGSPRAGKTTLAMKISEEHNIPVSFTDDLIPYGWSEASNKVVEWINRDEDWIIEGVSALRGLRKWFDLNRGSPCDQIVWLPNPVKRLSAGQETMRKGCMTIWTQVYVEIVRRKIPVVDLKSFLGREKGDG